jgi:hypothetical protein
MKKYILVVRHENNRESLLNQALYDSEAEAKKFRGWFKAKYEAECVANEKYWGEAPMKIGDKSTIFVGTVNY